MCLPWNNDNVKALQDNGLTCARTRALWAWRLPLPCSTNSYRIDRRPLIAEITQIVPSDFNHFRSIFAIMSTQNANANIDPKLIENMPAALLKELPAASPPPGLQPNFSDPPTQVPTILGVGIAFLTLAFLCFSIRIYTKVALVKRWKWDDCKWECLHVCSFDMSLTNFFYQ